MLYEFLSASGIPLSCDVQFLCLAHVHSPKGRKQWATVDPPVSNKGCVVFTLQRLAPKQPCRITWVYRTAYLHKACRDAPAPASEQEGLQSYWGEPEPRCSYVHSIFLGKAAKNGSTEANISPAELRRSCSSSWKAALTPCVVVTVISHRQAGIAPSAVSVARACLGFCGIGSD